MERVSGRRLGVVGDGASAVAMPVTSVAETMAEAVRKSRRLSLRSDSEEASISGGMSSSIHGLTVNLGILDGVSVHAEKR